MRKTFTYDDVNIVPKYSTLDSRSEVELKTRFTKNTNIDIPIVSSPMDTVTESNMSIEMMSLGGVGIIHRFNTIEEQVDHVIETTYFRDSEVRGKYSHLPICAAVGVTGDYLERATELFHNGCKVLLIDVAHGHHKNVGEAIEEIKTKLSGIEIIAGNVATESGTRFLCEKGADSIRVGIGNGSLCETRIRTGIGVPQVSALLECVSVADKYNVPIIADGGIRNIGDVCKGLACGADTIMLGSLLSGTKETPGEIEKVGQWPNEKLFKKYRGSASRQAKRSDKNVEGNHKVIPYKGKTIRILSDIKDGIRSSFSYVGANNITEFHGLVELTQVTQAGTIEAKPHLL